MEITEHPTCPVCKEGIGEMHKISEEEVEKGNKNRNVKHIPVAEIGVHVNFDPTQLPLIGGRVPAIRSYKDICEECGAIWSFRVEHGHVTYTGDVRMPFKDFK